MPRAATNLLHQVFGRLTVTARAENSSVGAARWVVQCVCGTEKIVRSSQLTDGNTLSCGCFAREKSRVRAITHGRTGTFEHNVWLAMRRRCTDPKHPRYHRYGGRGITVCKRWEKFENFFSDMGVCPFDKGSIERKNNDRGYTPSNCVWLLKSQQSKNRNFNPKH
jgi:hypothetical protein